MSVEITALPSGLRIVTDAMRDLETTSLGVWVAAGSRHEAAQEHGLSHFLEHMAFKGTRRRSAREIANEIETAGGDLNAATSVEQTAYYAHVLAADTGLALDILADILTDSVFDPEELKREKDVILQEIGAVEDTPDDLVFDLFNAAAFPEQPIGRPILGTPENVAAFDRGSLASYLDRHYAASVTVVAAAGAVDHRRIVDETARRFESLAANTHLPAVPARYCGGDRRLERKLGQTHLVVGFEGRSFHQSDAYAAHIFANAVGGGMSSRLFQEIREKRGLVYEIYAFHWAYADTGLFGFYAATSPRDVSALLPVALDCLGRAVQDLDEAEVLRAKAQMKVSLLAALESSSARAEQIARQLLAFDRVLSREEIIREIDGLTLEDIRRAGRAMLSTPATVAAVGKTAKVLAPDRIAEKLKGV